MNQYVACDEVEAAQRQRDLYGIPTYVYQAWRAQRHSSLRRGIPFQFTLLAWHCWWNDALIALGPNARRGRRRGEYVMARFGDAGAYDYDNVYAATAIQNSHDIPDDVRVHMTEKAEQTLAAKGQQRGAHLKVRGDGHPCSMAVVTPLGRFGSIALASEAHGITRAGGHYKVKRGEWTLE